MRQSRVISDRLTDCSRLLVASLYRCRRSRVKVRESARLVALSRAGLARGRLLLETTSQANGENAARRSRTKQRIARGEAETDASLLIPLSIWAIKRLVERV